MAKVTAAEFQKNFGRYRELAQREAVAVTNYGRDTVVLISAEEYARLRGLDEAPDTGGPARNPFERFRRHFEGLELPELELPERSPGREPPGFS